MRIKPNINAVESIVRFLTQNVYVTATNRSILVPVPFRLSIDRVQMIAVIIDCKSKAL